MSKRKENIPYFVFYTVLVNNLQSISLRETGVKVTERSHPLPLFEHNPYKKARQLSTLTHCEPKTNILCRSQVEEVNILYCWQYTLENTLESTNTWPTAVFICHSSVKSHAFHILITTGIYVTHIGFLICFCISPQQNIMASSVITSQEQLIVFICECVCAWHCKTEGSTDAEWSKPRETERGTGQTIPLIQFLLIEYSWTWSNEGTQHMLKTYLSRVEKWRIRKRKMHLEREMFCSVAHSCSPHDKIYISNLQYSEVISMCHFF